MKHDDREASRVRTDLLAVLLGSTLIVGYLFASLLQPAPAHADEAVAAPAHEELEGLREKISPAPAPWVEKGKPIPDWALYPYSDDPGRWAPEPELPAKQRTWYNRILFPTVRCPYCGRRVPTNKGSYIFLIVGLLGQIGFSGRFFVQWIASEKAKASVIPESFWWLSIVGSVLLLVYSISILAWPIILGQAPNVFIYARNLYFIHTHKKAAAQSAGTAAPDDPA